MQRVRIGIFLLFLVCWTLQLLAANERQALTDYFERRAFDTNYGYEDRLAAHDSIIALNPGDPHKILDKVNLMLTNMKMDEVYPILDSLCNIRSTLPLPMQIGLLDRMSYVQNNQEDFIGAYQTMTDMLEMPKPDSLNYYTLVAMVKLSEFYVNVNDYIRAEDWRRQASEMAQKMHWASPQEKNKVMTMILLSKAILEVRLQRFHEGYESVSNMLKLPLDKGDKLTANVLLGQIYNGLGREEEACKYFKKALEFDNPDPNQKLALVYLAEHTLSEEGPEAA